MLESERVKPLYIRNLSIDNLIHLWKYKNIAFALNNLLSVHFMCVLPFLETFCGLITYLLILLSLIYIIISTFYLSLLLFERG